MTRAAALAALAALWSVLFGMPPARAATLVYTNDVMGELEPCGCRVDPHGGLARKAGLLASLYDKEILQLDAGNLLFGSETIAPALRPQAELQAQYLVRGLNLLKQDASVPGPKDFALGLKEFEKLRAQAHFPFLAANLLRKGKTWLKPYEIFVRKSEGKKLRIGVLGLVGENLEWPPELKATPAADSARRWVPLLRKKADLVIALTHQGLDADMALAKIVPGIDLIVGGESLSFLMEPKKSGDTYIFQTSFRNQFAGVVSLESPFTPVDHRMVALDPTYDTDGPVAKLVAELKAKIARMNEAETKQANRETEKMFREMKFHTFPRCAGCHMKQFDFWRKTPHMRALQVLVDAGQSSNKECLSCHTVGLGDQQGFRHVQSLAQDPAGNDFPVPRLARLIRSMSEAKTIEDPIRIDEQDPEPQPVRMKLTALKRSFAPVQCENCHLPGAGHPFEGTYSKAVPKDTCLKCHTRDRALGWYTSAGSPDWPIIEQKRALVTCPAGD